MRNLALYAALSLGCLILAGVMFFGSSAVTDAAQCRRLLENHHTKDTTPDRESPERARYVECYRIICGIRLDG